MARQERNGSTRVQPESDHLAVQRPDATHPDHLIEDLNPVERNDAKYHESYPRHHER
jgi:hypothetical protein